MLVYPPCIDFILIFLSCLRAGIVAVPVYPPSSVHAFHLNVLDPSGIKKNVQLFSGIQENCQAKVALCNGYFNFFYRFKRSDYMKVKKLTDMKAFFSRSGVQWPDLEWVNTDELLSVKDLPEVPADEPSLHFSSSKLCFLQYTSGSTSLPKVCLPFASFLSLSLSAFNIKVKPYYLGSYDFRACSNQQYECNYPIAESKSVGRGRELASTVS